MPQLYVHNFRGFSKTLIPLSSVNFLVGENSTGKTSILALLNLIGSPNFWFSQNFNMPEHELGGFRDMLSASSAHREELSFGFCQKTRDAKTKEEKSYCYLASYREREALPAISFFSRLDGNKLLSVKRLGTGFRYRLEEIPSLQSAETPLQLFQLLENERCRDDADYQHLPKGMPSQAGLFPMLGMLESFAAHREQDLHELLFPVPLFAPDIAWLAPIRTKPRRTYDGYGSTFSPEGEHTPYLIRKRMRRAERAESFRTALKSFGESSGLFNDVMIKRLGADAAAPFELLVKLSPDYPLRINSVGYGVSQVLPVVVEMLARPKHSWFAIQQPEVHLHPRAQAALGDLIFEMAETEEKHFLIETHTDFTIDRFRLNFKRLSEHKTTGQVLFFERNPKGNSVHAIGLKPNGEYSDDQPKAFREFFLREHLSLLEL